MYLKLRILHIWANCLYIAWLRSEILYVSERRQSFQYFWRSLPVLFGGWAKADSYRSSQDRLGDGWVKVHHQLPRQLEHPQLTWEEYPLYNGVDVSLPLQVPQDCKSQEHEGLHCHCHLHCLFSSKLFWLYQTTTSLSSIRSLEAQSFCICVII